MWMLVGTIALVAVIVVALKVMERRASRDLDGAEDMSRIVRERQGRPDSYGGPGEGGWSGF